MSRKTYHMLFYIILSITILVSCAKPTENVTIPLILTDTQLPPTITSTSPIATSTKIPSTATASVPTMTSTPNTRQSDLWVDVTTDTIGKTENWTNKVELADINSDGLVDLLFANGGDYDKPGEPEFSQVFLNQGPGQMFKDVSAQVLGPTPMIARVIKVRDVNNDGQPDIFVGTTFQSQSQLYLGDGSGNFTNVTDTHLPQINSSVGDLEIGDIDNDSDLDVVLADWGLKSPMTNQGGRTMLWLNDGTGHFSDATETHMPNILVKFSWELELVDNNNDYDLDILVSCKMCKGSYLFENNGEGAFKNASYNLPQFTNNYDFEAMDINGDHYLDLVTINDAENFGEHIFLNNTKGGFDDWTDQLLLDKTTGCDDNMAVWLDYDSDGDSDLLIGSLSCDDRLFTNDGSGTLTRVAIISGSTRGTCGIAVADLNGDYLLDVVQAQGEAATPEKVYFGQNILPDSAPPVVTIVEKVIPSGVNLPIQIRARVHDNKSPTMPHDWQSVVLRWTSNGQTQETPMQWYGEYLWRGTIDNPPTGEFYYEVCAIDAAGNQGCSSP